MLEESYERFYQSKEFEILVNGRNQDGVFFYDRGIVRHIMFPPTNKEHIVKKLVSESWKQLKVPIIASFRKVPYAFFEQATVIIDLTKDKIFERLGKDVRWSIKKAEREGVIVRELESKADFDAFIAILKDLASRKKIHSININKFIDIPTFAKAYGAFLNGKLIGGGFFYRIGQMVLYESGAVLEGYYKYQPASLCLWRAISDAKKEGFTLFDLGGFDINAVKDSETYRINQFKRDWGELITYRHYVPYRFFYFIKKIKDLLDATFLKK